MTEAQATEPRIALRALAGSRARALGSLLLRHRALVLVLAAATSLRVLAMVAVYPGIWFSDTNSYLEVATTRTLSIVRVSGYALFVAPFIQLGSAAALIVTQHVLGLVIAVLLYAFLLRRGVSKIVAVVAVLPAALDGYLIALEHMIMSETVFHLAVVGAVVTLLWRERPLVVEAGAAGLLLGYAGVVRSVAVPFVALFVVYLLIRRVGLYPFLAFCLGWALVIVGYMTLFKIQHGDFAFTRWEGRFLYAKVAPFAKCSELGGLPADQRAFCPDGRRKYSSNGYLWGKGSPIHNVPASEDARIRDFALRVIEHKPLTYLKVVARDTIHYFEPAHRTGRNDYSVTAWEFPSDPRHWEYPGYRGPIRPGTARRLHTIDPGQYVNSIAGDYSTNVPASRFLHYYQRFLYTSGQILAGCLLLVLAALVRSPRRLFRMRLDAALIAACVVAGLVVASALSIFDFRYGLLAVIMLPVAGALAGTALFRKDTPGSAGAGGDATAPTR